MVQETSQIATVRKHLESAIADGFQVLSMTELMLEGAEPSVGRHDAMAEVPANVKNLTYILPHQNHLHLYNITLYKTGAPLPETRNLTDLILKTLQSIEMDEQATVGHVGQA